MKKIIALFVLVAVAVAAQAQSLTGKNWFCTAIDDDTEGGLVMLFDPEGACAMSLLMVEDNLTMTYMVPAKYTLERNVIRVTTFTHLSEIEIQFITEGLTPEQQSMLEMMKPALDQQKEQIKVGLNEEFAWTDEPFTITELTDTRLVITDSKGKEMIFSPVEE